MKVILQQNVPKVGKKYDVVEVAQGYADHALFPKKLAIPATPKALQDLARHKASLVEEKAFKHKLLDDAINTLRGRSVVIKVKANEQGSLFSKVDEQTIAAVLASEHRIAIDPKLITIKDGPIKKLGTYTIDVTDEGYHATWILTVA